ncbi:hypothetical protein YPPY34_0444, partial [Yersinia pestis PY-34]
MAFCG